MCASIFNRMFGNKTSDQNIGQRGEQFAAAKLREKGYSVLDRNWRCSFGEIDIVAELGDTIVFVEVKSSLRRGNIPPELRVNNRKQHKLRQLAAHYLKMHHRQSSVRFDIVAVWGEHELSYEHIENAFA